MRYRELGKTGLMVSEIGFGGEWLKDHDEDEAVELIKYAHAKGINIIDCWMPDPKSRDIIGKGIVNDRSSWYVQGHFGPAYIDEQYTRTRDLTYVIPAFEDLLKRLQTDYIDLGMIHYIDSMQDWHDAMESGFLDYVKEMRAKGVIRHIGMSTHNPQIGKMAVETGLVENLLFSINPAFDMRPATDDLGSLFEEKHYDESYAGIDPERAEFYRLCEEKSIGLTVMKGFFGGRLFDPQRSPFGVAFTPVQCIHYALTRPAVASILCGYDTKQQIDAAVAYEDATDEQKDYASILANAPLHSYKGQCTYCGHCKPCPMDIDIAQVNKFYDLASAYEKTPESIQRHYESLSHKAGECIGCQSCEERCPFGVKIAERMILTKERFGC